MHNKPLLFPPELRTAAIVPRWSIVWTLNKDTVTNHSYFVTMYAHAIARLLDWEGSLAGLMYLALTHDLDETITGDIVSPVKAEIMDHKRAQDYIDLKMHERLPDVMRHIEEIGEFMTDKEQQEAWSIIMVADRLDALLFLLTEKRMGNGIIDPRIPSAMSRLESSWRNIPCENQHLRDQLWATVVLPSIKAHTEAGGGHGV